MEIKLNKKIYGAKGALDNLDENFVEFLPKKRNYKEFFNSYNQNFYDISDNDHRYFISSSLEYVRDYKNPKQIQIEDLQNQIQNKIEQIDSVEQEHPFFPNNVIIAPDTYRTRAEYAIEDIGRADYLGLHFLYSGKKRKIQDKSIYTSLKGQLNPLGKSDEEFLIFLPISTIGRIPTGPPIEDKNQVWIPFIDVNIYGRNTGTFNISETVEASTERGTSDRI